MSERDNIEMFADTNDDLAILFESRFSKVTATPQRFSKRRSQNAGFDFDYEPRLRKAPRTRSRGWFPIE